MAPGGCQRPWRRRLRWCAGERCAGSWRQPTRFVPALQAIVPPRATQLVTPPDALPFRVAITPIMAAMSTRPFEPKFMKVGVLTAALQELTPRDVRDADPDRAIEEWLEFARELGAGYIQLSAALHPSESDVPPEAMLDPVANTLDLRRPFDKNRARRVEAALKSTGVGLSDVAYFDNMLHHDRCGAPEEARVHAARVRRRGAAGRRRRLRIRRPQSAAQHGPEPPRFRSAVRAAAARRQNHAG